MYKRVEELRLGLAKRLKLSPKISSHVTTHETISKIKNALF
jgi:hypothetical protein